MPTLLRFDGAVPRDPTVDRWLSSRPGGLGEIARTWFAHIRDCGSDVRELLHDGCPTACVEGAGFAYVNVFTRHVNVGFFQGTSLHDPSDLLEGTGKYMRHVKLREGGPADEAALRALVAAAYTDILAKLAREAQSGRAA